MLRKEARFQEEEQEQLHMSTQQLKQENRQILARAEQEKEQTWEVERNMKIIEQRLMEMEKEDMTPNMEHQLERMEELKNKVGEKRIH